MTANIEALERLLEKGSDSAVLRFSLGTAYLDTDPARAADHFRHATILQSDYSAAWKMLGRACARSGDPGRAREAFERGIEVAQQKGDVQAAKEMQVFLKRLSRPPA